MSNISQQILFSGNVSIPSNIGVGGDIFYSDQEKGDGYFGFGDGIHTVTYTVSSDFTGYILMQGSLATDPTTTDWFEITGTRNTYTNTVGTIDITNYFNFTGNFVWVRAKVLKQTGYLAAINYNH